jgi:hypothetical protein
MMKTAICIALVVGAALFAIGRSTPAVSQTCQQNCQAQYPLMTTSRHDRRARNRCINRCVRLQTKR